MVLSRNESFDALMTQVRSLLDKREKLHHGIVVTRLHCNGTNWGYQGVNRVVIAVVIVVTIAEIDKNNDLFDSAKSKKSCIFLIY